MGRSIQHNERDRYVVFVMWLCGKTQAYIAKWTGLTKRQVGGLVERSPYANRSAMRIDERQRHLDDLKAIRNKTREGGPIDGFLLGTLDFLALPLEKEQVRGERSGRCASAAQGAAGEGRAAGNEVGRRVGQKEGQEEIRLAA